MAGKACMGMAAGISGNWSHCIHPQLESGGWVLVLILISDFHSVQDSTLNEVALSFYAKYFGNHPHKHTQSFASIMIFNPIKLTVEISYKPHLTLISKLLSVYLSVYPPNNLPIYNHHHHFQWWNNTLIYTYIHTCIFSCSCIVKSFDYSILITVHSVFFLDHTALEMLERTPGSSEFSSGLTIGVLLFIYFINSLLPFMSYSPPPPFQVQLQAKRSDLQNQEFAPLEYTHLVMSYWSFRYIPRGKWSKWMLFRKTSSEIKMIKKKSFKKT